MKFYNSKKVYASHTGSIKLCILEVHVCSLQTRSTLINCHIQNSACLIHSHQIQKYQHDPIIICYQHEN